MAQGGGHVGERPNACLPGGVGIADHHGVEADAGHHREHLASGLAEVDLLRGAVDRDVDGFVGIGADAEVAGEKVAGTGRDDRKWCARPRESSRTGAHRAVATADDDEGGASRDRGLRLPGARVVLRGRHDDDAARALRAQRLGDVLAVGGVATLRIDDHVHQGKSRAVSDRVLTRPIRLGFGASIRSRIRRVRRCHRRSSTPWVVRERVCSLVRVEVPAGDLGQTPDGRPDRRRP